MQYIVSIETGLFAFALLSFTLCSPAVKLSYNETYLAESQILNDPFPYDFPQRDQPGSDLFQMQLCNGLKLEEATIDDLQRWMSLGELSARSLVECYLDRITQTDGYVR